MEAGMQKKPILNTVNTIRLLFLFKILNHTVICPLWVIQDDSETNPSMMTARYDVARLHANKQSCWISTGNHTSTISFTNALTKLSNLQKSETTHATFRPNL